MKHQAIYNLYPNAKSIDENADGFEVKDDNGNEVSIDISTVNTKATELQTAEDNKETAKATAQESGNTKLLSLGLSQAEATALTGYKPSED
tara:strand:+ start:542 stop:814 length:273 start_codon:yes stop_codon:yes gene_type:complete